MPRQPLPDGLEDVLRIVRDTIAACEEQGHSEEAIVTAFLTEIMPRVVGRHGPEGVAVILRYVQGRLGVVEAPMTAPN